MVVCIKYHPELEDSIKIQAVCMIFFSILNVKIGSIRDGKHIEFTHFHGDHFHIDLSENR